MVDFKLVPENTVLMNIDLQNCFVDNADRGLEVVNRVNYLAKICRTAGILVIHTRHVVRPDHSNVGTVLSNFAGLYREQGRYTEAEPLDKAALAIADKARHAGARSPIGKEKK